MNGMRAMKFMFRPECMWRFPGSLHLQRVDAQGAVNPGVAASRQSAADCAWMKWRRSRDAATQARFMESDWPEHSGGANLPAR